MIERGSERSYKHTPSAMDIYGAGVVINDADVSQLVITTQGVRTHIGNVMGGGTSINMAIYIDETKEYFKYLEDNFSGTRWDWSLLDEVWLHCKHLNVYDAGILHISTGGLVSSRF